jgi:hypothetical protein
MGRTYYIHRVFKQWGEFDSGWMHKGLFPQQVAPNGPAGIGPAWAQVFRNFPCRGMLSRTLACSFKLQTTHTQEVLKVVLPTCSESAGVTAVVSALGHQGLPGLPGCHLRLATTQHVLSCSLVDQI